MKDIKVGIVGAGLTGLVAAKTLSNQGIQVTVFEKLNQAGGRIRTEKVSGWKLDVGFQVLLTAYPYLQEHVDLKKLDTITLDAAATIYRAGKITAVGDPFRTKNVLLKTLFSDIGSIKDKWLIYKFKRYVDRKTITEIFELSNRSSIEFLASFGFSERIIDRFFKPFFGGIFLERELHTSSRMLLFVFKMFAEGSAVIPKEGIGAVAAELLKEMEHVIIHYNSTVLKVENESIYFENGEKESFDYVINTIPDYGKRQPNNKWEGCNCLYFEHASPAIIAEPRIGLNANQNRFINSIFYPSVYHQPKGGSDTALLSVTVLDSMGLTENELVKKVGMELKSDFNISAARFIKSYPIIYALPKLEDPSDSVSFDSSTNTFEVGDFILNGSQNAACKVGELIAKTILEKEN